MYNFESHNILAIQIMNNVPNRAIIIEKRKSPNSLKHRSKILLLLFVKKRLIIKVIIVIIKIVFSFN